MPRDGLEDEILIVQGLARKEELRHAFISSPGHVEMRCGVRIRVASNGYGPGLIVVKRKRPSRSVTCTP